MEERLRRKLDKLLVGILFVTGGYGTLYLGSLLWGPPERPLYEVLTSTFVGNLFLLSVLAWVGILGGWKARAIHRNVARDPDAAQQDEVATKLRDALDDRD